MPGPAYDGSKVTWDISGASLEAEDRSLVLLLGRESVAGPVDQRLDGMVREMNNLLASLVMQTELTLEEVPPEEKCTGIWRKSWRRPSKSEKSCTRSRTGLTVDDHLR